MNFLAHFLLAKPTSASRTGNFLGDFITGTPESLSQILPKEIIEGIVMHRKIDVFTDAHPTFKEGKKLLKPERRRFAGIILDVFTDHFLAKNWEDYSDQTLEGFSEEIDANLRAHWAFFPDDARYTANWMTKGNWFCKYATEPGIRKALAGLSKRRPKFDPIAGATAELTKHYSEFEELSKILLEDALSQKF